MENNHSNGDLKLQVHSNHAIQATVEIHDKIEHHETVSGVSPVNTPVTPTSPTTPIPDVKSPKVSTSVSSPPSSASKPSRERKKSKNRTKSRGKKKSSKGGQRSRSRRGRDGQPLSLGGGANRRMSRPHHATVKSLASINQPAIVNQLSKMSQDLKFRRELRKALTELKQKEEDYRYAIEIGESLTKENEYLKRQLDEVETQLAAQENDNNLLKKKLETLSLTYRSDLYKYHQDLQAHKELVTELTNEVNAKEEELSQQQIKTQHKYRYGGPGAAKMDDIVVTRLTNEDISNLTAADLKTKLEKQLYLEVQREMDMQKEHEKQVETLIRRLDSMQNLKQQYDELKKEKRELESIVEEQQQQHLQMQKSIEAEAIYLATQKANLEEENESLLNILDQRDYEVQILNQQLQLQQRHAAAAAEQGRFSDAASVGSNLYNIQYQYDPDTPFDAMSVTSLEYFHPYGQQPMDNEEDGDQDDEAEGDEDEDDDGVIDEIADLMDNTSVFDELDEEKTQRSGTSAFSNPMIAPMAAPMPVAPSVRRAERERRRKEEQKKDQKAEAFDKIKEYLHLTASAVKIKYPTVRNVASHDLIKKVKELPFYKYHDQMVKIMENEMKKKREADRAKREKEKSLAPKPTLEKRNSFMSMFGFFGGAKPTPKEDEKEKEKERAKATKTPKETARKEEEDDTDGADYMSEGKPMGNGYGHGTETSDQNGRGRARSSSRSSKKRKRSRSRKRPTANGADDTDGSETSRSTTAGARGGQQHSTPEAQVRVESSPPIKEKKEEEVVKVEAQPAVKKTGWFGF